MRKIILIATVLLFEMPAFAQSVGPGPSPLRAIVLQARLTSSQGVTDSTNTVIKFNTVDIDTQAAYSATTGQYKPTLPGKYSVCVNLEGQVATTMAATILAVSKNGLVQSGYTRAEAGALSATAAASQSVTVCSIVALNGTTDTVEADGQVVGTGGTDVFVGATNASTFLNISYLGN